VNQKQRDEFWKDAAEYTGAIPYYRFHDEWYYLVTDSGYTPVDEYTLREALDLFHDVTDGENCAVYLYRGGDHLATYNGGQSDPEGETTYHVTKSALPEWLAALAGRV
jgi:hypothetical protein